jgi:hypothetical protein
MKSLGELRKQAEQSCTNRGHRMVWSSPYHGESRSIQCAVCSGCGKEAHINTNPSPNGIDIGGEAVALNCEVE